MDGSGSVFNTSGLIPDLSSLLHTTFPDDPTSDYCIAAERILSYLKLEVIWAKEFERLKTEDDFGIKQAAQNQKIKENKLTNSISPSQYDEQDSDLMTQKSESSSTYRTSTSRHFDHISP